MRSRRACFVLGGFAAFQRVKPDVGIFQRRGPGTNPGVGTVAGTIILATPPAAAATATTTATRAVIIVIGARCSGLRRVAPSLRLVAATAAAAAAAASAAAPTITIFRTVIRVLKRGQSLIVVGVFAFLVEVVIGIDVIVREGVVSFVFRGVGHS